MSKQSSRSSQWKAQRQRVLDRDGWVCTSCGRQLVGSDATVDHCDPVALNPGKEYRDDELVAMCRRCNGIKSDRVKARQTWFDRRWLEQV